MSSRIQCMTVILFLGWAAPAAFAQMPIPVHGDCWWECWSIRERTVDIWVQEQVASVTVTDRVVNPGDHAVEIEYLFPLPPDAAVDQFTLVVDGRELTGRMLDAVEARMLYDEIVRRRQDPGLLEYAGCGLYRSSAFPLGPHQTAELVVHYTACCKKDGDVVELWYPMTTGRFGAEPVGHFQISVEIESLADIVNVYSPTLDLTVDHRTPNRVGARYEAHGYRPLEDFQLFYETSQDQVGATLLTYWPDRKQDGYYLLLVSPNPRAEAGSELPKDILVVLDRSGSMSGAKIAQARDAARFVLHNLNPRDRFNFITYSDRAELCFESLLPASPRNVALASERLDRVEASGSTNIYQALDVAMGQFPPIAYAGGDGEHRPAFIIFLTDGLPTTGNTNEQAILGNTTRANQADVRLFAFGVGYDVNVRLLDNLVQQNHGRSGYVKPNESIEARISALYRRIQNPFMTNVSVALDRFDTRDDCPADLGDLFEGDQLLRTGRIYPRDRQAFGRLGTADYPVTLTLTGTLEGTRRSFEYPVSLDAGSRSTSHQFVEKLWATRRIGQLLAEIQLHGRVDEIVDELIHLSQQYGIVTPYTSYLADEEAPVASAAEIRIDVSAKARAGTRTITGPQAQMDAVAREEALDVRSLSKLRSPQGSAMRMGASTQDAYERGASESVGAIRVVGNETLYKRGDCWMTAAVSDRDPVKDRSQFTVVQRFSEAYFALTRANTVEENKVLASQKPDEKLAVLLRGTAYLIE